MHLFLRSFSFELFLSETLSLSHLWLTIWESAFLGEMDGALKRVTFPLMFNFGEDWYLLDNGEETNFYTISFSPFFVLILHFLILPSFCLPISKLSENTQKKNYLSSPLQLHCDRSHPTCSSYHSLSFCHFGVFYGKTTKNITFFNYIYFLKKMWLFTCLFTMLGEIRGTLGISNIRKHWVEWTCPENLLKL